MWFLLINLDILFFEIFSKTFENNVNIDVGCNSPIVLGMETLGIVIT